MKKSFLMLGLAVAAMTSCTNDEVVEVNQSNLIKFESFVNKGTRAVTETTATENFSKFYVFGYYGTTPTTVFNNVAVNKTQTTTDNGKNVWDTETLKEWTANTYEFGAYATKNSSTQLEANTAVSFSNATLTFTNYEAKADEDLVAAVTTVSNTGLTNPYVDLTFKHLLSKVKFTFTNVGENTKDYTMKVSNITVNGVLPQGTCTYTTTGAAWVASGAAGDLTYVGTTNNIEKNAAYESEEFHIIPQALTDIKATFTVEFYNGVDKVDEISYTNISLNGDGQSTAISSWAPGYIYNYTANLPADPKYIQFTASVTPWDSQDVDDIDSDENIEF